MSTLVAIGYPDGGTAAQAGLQRAFRVLDRPGFWLPLVCVVLAGAGVLWSRDRGVAFLAAEQPRRDHSSGVATAGSATRGATA
jgi:hypothetical protein